MAAGSSSSSSDDLLEVVAKMGGVVAAVLGSAGAVLVGPAELGGWLVNGHRWLPLEPTQLLTIAWYWIHHLSDPMGGWPAAERALLPARPLYLLLLVLELALLAALVWVGFRVVLFLRGDRPGRQRQQSQRFARPGDLRR